MSTRLNGITSAVIMEAGKLGKRKMLVLDTYSHFKKLTDAGMSEKLASVQARAWYTLAEIRLATKHDPEKMEAELKTEIPLIVKKLKDAGMSEKIASVQAEAFHALAESWLAK